MQTDYFISSSRDTFAGIDHQKRWTPRTFCRVPFSRLTQTDAHRVDESEDSEDEHEPQYDISEYGDDAVSRMYTVNREEAGKCNRRTFLLHVRGAKSFENICRVDGELCPTFREACGKRGLSTREELRNCTLPESFRSRFVPLSEMFAFI